METILLGMTVLFGLYMAWNIGANDVANAMGTSVGSHALTFKKAILIAAIFEFCGAFLAGGNVTDTISGKILNAASIGILEASMMKGMLAALIGSALWIHVATFFGLPVSTSHSIIGGVIGFGLFVAGAGSIQWNQVGFIAASWVVSPITGALLGAWAFIFIRNKILDTRTPLKNFVRWSPYMLFFIGLILFTSLFFKGLKNISLELDFFQTLLLSGSISLVLSLASSRILSRFIMKKIQNRDLLDGDQYGKQYQIIEETFKYLQIVTACFMAFAHGSNDVANATGPIVAIIARMDIITTSGSTLNSIILGLGALGIVVGLFTYGVKVIKTIGVKITSITPSRGFSAEFGASLTILIGSKLGLPISTTHTVVGAIVGIGFARGIAALNLRTLKNILSSWFITLPAAALLTILAYIALDALF